MQLVEKARRLCMLGLLALSVAGAWAQEPTPGVGNQPTVPDQVEAAFRWGNFAELERLYALYGKSGVRSPLTGAPRIGHFWMGIGQITKSNLKVSDAYYLQLDALTGQWAREHPQSVMAQVLHARSLVAHAWAHRGNGLAKTVSPAAWAEFGKYLERAAEHLQRTEALAVKDSSWNEVLLDVGRGLGWDTSRLMAVFEDGIAKNPDHENLYFVMQTNLLPKWGGNLETVDRFIALAVKNTREKLGMEMYARLYAGLSYDEVEQQLFTQTRASWASMKVGFEDRLRRYPHEDHRNMFAYFACMAKDKATLQEQLDQLGERYNALFWGSNPARNYEACKQFAQQV